MSCDFRFTAFSVVCFVLKSVYLILVLGYVLYMSLAVIMI